MCKRMEGLNIENFRSENFVNKIKDYGHFISSWYGLHSHSVMITNSTGCTSLANSSLNISENLVFSHPAIKLINAYIEAQNEAFGLFGSYLGIMCCSLFTKSAQNTDIAPFQLQSVADNIFDFLKVHMENVKLKLDIGNFRQVFKFARTMLFSKDEKNCLHEYNDVIFALVKAFVITTPTGMSQKFGNVYVLPFDHYCPTKVIPGLCLHQSHLPRQSYDKLNHLFSRKVLKIVIFNIPIAYNVPETRILQNNSNLDFNSDCFTLLKTVFIKWKVNVIFCQKYINEEIKFDLERSGFIVFERLGLDGLCALLAVAKCLPICSLNNLELVVDTKYIGSVLMSMDEINEKYFLVIQHEEYNCDATLIVSETVATEGNIKKKVESCLKILRSTITNPYVVPGAGCFEASCILALLDMKKYSIESISDNVKLQASAVRKVIDLFIEVFSDLAMIATKREDQTRLNYAVDLHSGHLWRSENAFQNDTADLYNCMCNRTENKHRCYLTLAQLCNSYDVAICKCSQVDSVEEISKSDHIFDYFPAKDNAIKLAFNAFADLFRVSLCIYDNA